MKVTLFLLSLLCIQVTLASRQCLPLTGSWCQSPGLCLTSAHPITRLPGWCHSHFFQRWANAVNIIWRITTEIFEMLKWNDFFKALVDDIPLRNLGGVFDAVNDSRDFVNDSRSASPTPSLVSNRSGFESLKYFSTVDIWIIHKLIMFFFFPALYQAVSCAMASQKQARPVRREPCQDRSTADFTKEGTAPTSTPEILTLPTFT